jgi:pantoate kinase
MHAFCPGHITGFFTIEDSHPDVLRRGSRGVGFCADAGATADVALEAVDKCEILVVINGEKADAPVTRRGIEHLLQGKGVKVTVDIQLGAPLSQGFGLSSAGTFAACLALADIMGFDNAENRALEATHRAEVELGAGLRETPGIGAFGRVRNIPVPYREVVVCVVGEGLSTERIIGSEELKSSISTVGAKCMGEFALEPTFDSFLRLSRVFSNETALATPEMTELLDAVSDNGHGSMAMLGNAVFAFGDADVLEKEMARFGKVIRTSISHSGARLIRSG